MPPSFSPPPSLSFCVGSSVSSRRRLPHFKFDQLSFTRSLLPLTRGVSNDTLTGLGREERAYVGLGSGVMPDDDHRSFREGQDSKGGGMTC